MNRQIGSISLGSLKLEKHNTMTNSEILKKDVKVEDHLIFSEISLGRPNLLNPAEKPNFHIKSCAKYPGNVKQNKI